MLVAIKLVDLQSLSHLWYYPDILAARSRLIVFYFRLHFCCLSIQLSFAACSIFSARSTTSSTAFINVERELEISNFLSMLTLRVLIFYCKHEIVVANWLSGVTVSIRSFSAFAHFYYFCFFLINSFLSLLNFVRFRHCSMYWSAILICEKVRKVRKFRFGQMKLKKVRFFPFRTTGHTSNIFIWYLRSEGLSHVRNAVTVTTRN